MKKLAIAGALMLLAGCAEVENYNNVVKTPAPDWLAGYWQTKGPQRALVSPEAIGSLIVTKEGDTLDCRQWQRVIAVPGKLTLMSDDLTNVTVKRELILFDEPTSALDPELVGEVLNTIRQLAQEKRTMVIVTHEMSFARDVADRAIFMDQGRIVEQGAAKALFADPQQPRTRQFLEKFLLQ